MKNSINPISLLYITLLTFLIALPQAHAGKLGSFERDATRTEDKQQSSPPTSTPSEMGKKQDEHHHDEGSSFLGELFFDLIFLPLEYGGISSLLRVNSKLIEESSDIGKIENRAPGEPVIPFTRMDLHLQHIASNLFAVDSRAEFGYGPVGLTVRHTAYRESDPKDTLSVTQAAFLYRMSFSKYVEVDIGIGQGFISGEGRHVGLLATFPIQVQTGRPLGFQFRPAFYQGVEDYDLGLLFTRPFSSYQAGYRWVEAGESRLNGPYIGASFHY